MSRTGNVRVAFRVRPPEVGCIRIDRERSRVSVHDTDGVLHHFSCDRVFDGGARQSRIFEDSVAPLVTDFLAGRNCSVFAYGETGSGKTYTILGPSKLEGSFSGNGEMYEGDETVDGDDFSSLGSAGVSRNEGIRDGGYDVVTRLPPGHILSKNKVRRSLQSGEKLRKALDDSVNEDSGIAFRIAKEIHDTFRRRRKGNATPATDDPTLSFSFLEVYDERIIDLLDDDAARTATENDYSLSVRSTPDQGVYVEGAIEIGCLHESDASVAVDIALKTREQRFEKSDATGEFCRSRFDYDFTLSHKKMLPFQDNASHLVLIWKLERYSKSKGKRTKSSFFVVDLANSALVRKPPVDARLGFVRECKSVKKSLGALRKCLRCLALVQKLPSPPYGESVLTQILHNGLVRGSGISIIVTANPELQHAPESMSAIRFGAYVAGQKGEEIDDLPRKPSSVGLGGALSSPRSPDSRRNSEATLALTSRRPSEATTKSHSNNMSGVFHSAPGLSEFSSSSETTHGELRKSPTNQTSSYVVNNKVKKSGSDSSFSSGKMQKQLETVSTDLKRMQFGDRHASYTRNDLTASELDLKRVSMNIEDSNYSPSNGSSNGRNSLAVHLSKQNRDHGIAESEVTPVRSGAGIKTLNALQALPASRSSPLHATGAGIDADVLRAELADLKEAYGLLQQQQAAKAQELANARQEIQELKSVKEDRRIEETSGQQNGGIVLGIDRTRTEVSNSVSDLTTSAVVEDNSDDWDEQRIELVPSPVCVCLRLRPMTKLERNRRSRSCIEVHEGGREFTVDSPLDGEYDFCFDHVFDTESTQEEVFDTVGTTIVDNLLDGVNCSVMVYGLAGSGKSHTLSGKLPEMLKEEDDDDSSYDETASSSGSPTEHDAGFSPRLVANLFRGMKDSPSTVEYRITCSYVCIYLEKLFDLLDPRFDKTLVVRDSTAGIHIEGAVEAFCFVEEDIIHLIRRGAACRKLIGNKLAIDASRSHSILILNLEQRHIQSGRVRRSYLQLVELAGFEVTSKAKGQSLQETKIIHKSFSALGNVVKALTEGNPHVPYRESKLTSIVKDALGGNCKTTMFITASPSSYHISETINSIRLGQRVRRVVNNPRVNLDASVENYRKWLLDSEVRLNELSGFVKCMAAELLESSEKDLSVKDGFSADIWHSIQALADEEECNANPCRKALILEEDDFLEPAQQKWRALTIELARKLPSAKVREVITERDRALSIVSDIQSESVILRRQNDLLVADKRKAEDELASFYRENRDLKLQITELTHHRHLAENRAKDAVIFLRYMRTLCWKLRKDIESDRPIDISDITKSLQGAPDLTGLVDLDTMMVESGFIINKDVDIEKVETEYFDYLQRTGLIIDEEQVAAEEEVDELAFLDDGIGSVASDNRWRKAQTTHSRSDRMTDQSVSSIDESRPHGTQDTFLGLPLPWLAPKPQERMHRYMERAQAQEGVRNTRGERELLRDLQNMANKCVELQMELNHLRQFMHSLTSKSTTLKMKNLTQECLQLAKERDRVLHNAKATTWKLHEMHVVNNLLVKQAADSKVQIGFLEDGFQRLQESFRSSVQESLLADQALHDRVRALQSIVDSLTGPFHEEESDQDDDPDTDSDGDSVGSANLLLAKIHLPLRGRLPPDPRSVPGGIVLVDPSGPQSVRRCLWYRRRGKRLKKCPSLMTRRESKFVRRSYKVGTALIGEHRVRLQHAYERGKHLVLPVFLDDDEESHYSDDDEYRHHADDYTR